MVNKPIFHVLMYQLTWASTLVGWLYHMVWLGPVVAGLYILTVCIMRRNPKDGVFILLFASVGWLIETGHQLLHLIQYTDSPLAPWWIAPLWGAFSLFCGIGMVWLRKTWIASILGAVGGPLTYMAVGGWAHHVLSLQQIAMFALIWAIAFPVFCHFSQKAYAK